MKKVVLTLVALLMLAPVAYAGLGCSDDDEAEVTWTLASFAIPGDIMHDSLLYFADQVNERSEGRMEIKVSHTLYEGTGIFDAVSAGNVDMGLIAGTWLGDKMPKYTSIYVQPFGENIKERLLIQEAVFAECEPILEESQDNNVMTPFMVDAGDLHAMFDRDVEVKEDVAGLHLWSAGDVMDPIIETFGATPVPLDVTGIYMAAQTGTIDGTLFMAVDMYYNQKFYEVMNYMVLGGGIHFGSTVLMNTNSFESLPADLQDIVMDAGLDAQDYSINAKSSQYDSMIADLEADPDVHVYELPASEAARWQDETIYPILQYAMYMSLSEDEIAQVMTVVAAAEANL